MFRNRPRKISASQTDATIPHVQLIRIVKDYNGPVRLKDRNQNPSGVDGIICQPEVNKR
jgi:hypothetical protein